MVYLFRKAPFQADILDLKSAKTASINFERMICMYLDPGFGGMLLQLIVAIAAVGGGLLFSFRKKIGGLFKKDDGKPKKAASDVSEAADDAIDVLDK